MEYCTYNLLCGDPLFTVWTDHRNLLSMTVRCFVALSEFSFILEFKPSVDNNIEDSWSRLCRNNMIDSPKRIFDKKLSIESHKLSGNAVLADDLNQCSWFYNIDMHANEISEHRPIDSLPDQCSIPVIVCTYTHWVKFYHTIDATEISAAECRSLVRKQVYHWCLAWRHQIC